MTQFALKQGAALRFAQARIVRLDPRDRQQFGDNQGVHRRVLPHVERRQMKAEHVHGADQIRQRSGHEGRALIFDQRPQHRLEIVGQLGRTGIRIGRHRRWPGRGRAREQGIGGGEPGIDAGQGAPIGLIGAVRRGVVRPVGQGLQIGRHPRQAGCDRKLGAERVDLIQIECQRRARLAQQGQAHHRRGHIGIAIPIAADPGADLQKTVQGHVLAEHIAPIGVEPGDSGQKAALEIRDRVFDFIADGNAERAQKPRFPEDRYVAQQRLFGATALAIGRGLLEQVEVVADRPLVIQDTLAANFAGMGGDHRGDEGA